MAAGAALGLFVALFLPWYQETVIAQGVTRLASITESLTGWAAFSFVEAAVLLVAAGVLVLVYMRAQGRAFHVPGGDGGIITAAGFWTCVLIVWRMFDKTGTTGHGEYATTSGIEWGIFIALVLAGVLTYAGTRIRRAHDPEPPLPGEAGPVGAPGGAAAGAAAAGGVTPGGAAGGGASAGAATRGRVTAGRAENRLSFWERAARKAFGPPAGEPPRPPSRRPRPAASAAASDHVRSARAPEMDADETWTQSAGPTPRARPRSIAGDGELGQPATGAYHFNVGDLDIADPPTSPLARARPATPRRDDTHPGRPTPAAADAADTVRLSGDEAPTLVGSDAGAPLPGSEAPTLRTGERPPRGRAEAPTSRIGRGRPPRADAEPPEDQLTMRLDPPH